MCDIVLIFYILFCRLYVDMYEDLVSVMSFFVGIFLVRVLGFWYLLFFRGGCGVF